ncbi:uncharacterized protein RJT20DRAFT_129967 [Scheffersomyces xylosifermentans]|uniref:uncharacterized protein n=1 Tax=Scheffersomyces xylosifermentans TaxID=1304137 RepID=UPI00315CED55
MDIPSSSYRGNGTVSHAAGSNSVQAVSSRYGSISTTGSGKKIGVVDPNEFITYIISDFNAVRYFQKAFIASGEFHLLEESTISGFDIYLVEQWVNDRKIGTVISTFTGNPSSKVAVVRFTIMKKQSKYYPVRFQEYLNELMLNHSKIKQMDENNLAQTVTNTRASVGDISLSNSSFNGSLASLSTADFSTNEVCFVTNLSSLPSNLNLIPIASGDPRTIETAFVINSDLKKLQCSGRSVSLVTDKMSDANEDKFRQMYKIYNVNIPVKFAIRELVNVIQICLFYFDLLDPKYCDGLLCNKTEEAILNWWNLIGLPHFNIKPNPKQGVLPSRTVAAIISLVLSIKLRLQLIGGCDVPKDAFDFENFMLSIGQFQKQYKLEKRHKLDLETLNKLFTVTNAKLIPDKNAASGTKIYNSPENMYDPEDNFFDLTASSSISTNARSSINSPSQYKKNKYGMEFKKLTNVVMNTVQDRITAKDADDMSMSATKSGGGGRIRNRIAKLADNVTPLDVETLDLEFLVKNHLNGKTLFRLFHGVNSAASVPLPNGDNSSQAHTHVHHTHNHTHRHRNGPLADDIAKQYTFLSLRDKLTQSQNPGTTSMTDISRYSRGLSKMKLGLQNRRNLLTAYNAASKRPQGFTGASQLEHLRRPSTDSKKMSLMSNSIVDSLLQIPSEVSSFDGLQKQPSPSSISGACEPVDDDGALCDNPLKTFSRNLNRRNSYPYLLNCHEANLNLLVLSKKDNVIDPAVVWNSHTIRRSLSCSAIDNCMFKKPDIAFQTIDIFSDRYLHNINSLMKYDNLKKLYDTESVPESLGIVPNGNLIRTYQVLNLELKKLGNVQNQMNMNKSRVVDEDLIGNLKYDVHQLSTTIDRLVYETRIVIKRINELEEYSKDLDIKLNDRSRGKMTKLIDTLIHSRKFEEVFSNVSERNEIISRLGGTIEVNTKEVPEKQSIFGHMFKMIIVFSFELVTYLFHIFKFDRAHMNLDRIRDTWVKLDPNRDIIKSAYSMIGRQPARDSVASVDGVSVLQNRDSL